MDQILEQARSIYEGEIVRTSSLFVLPLALLLLLVVIRYMCLRSLAHGVASPRQDFEGQRLAEFITYGILTVTGLLAFGFGIATGDIHQTLYIGLGGTALTFLAVVPPWPFFNQHPLPWLPSRATSDALHGVSIEVDGKKVR